MLLNREGSKVGKKLVYRLYCEEGLALRHKPPPKRRASLQQRERCRPAAPNEVCSTGASITGDALRGIARAAVNRRYALTSWVGVELLVSV